MALPAPEQLVTALASLAPGIALEGANLLIDAKQLIPLCRFLKSSPEYQMDYLSNVTAVDYPPERIEMIYHLYSMAKKHGPIGLKVKLPRATPAIASLVPLYRGAEFQEREVYDLYGVTFEGHPDLRRILMWDEFEGHPMRKDYVIEDQDQPLPKAA